MSDIKNPAPFYMLKDAAKELNRLLKADYYNSERLLTMALVYDLKLYIYSEGWEGQYIYNAKMSQEYNEFLREENYLTGYSEAQERKDNTLKIITNNTISCLLGEGCLLQLSLDVIKKFRFQKKCEFAGTQYSFNEAIYLEDAFNPQTKAYLLEELKAALETDQEYFRIFYQSYLDKKTLDAIVDINVDGIELKKPRDVSIQDAKPKYTGSSVVNDENALFFTGQDSEYAVDQEDGNDQVEEYAKFEINRKDILITHSQLMRILEGSLSIRDVQHRNKKELIEPRMPNKPQGVSVAKKNAKLAAKTLANYLWKQDTENKIKILDMAITVRAELYQTEHREQLPDQSVSLKKWIEDIAPEYAREAGRPKGI